MSDECKDCIHIRNLEDKIRSLWHALNEVKGQNKDFEKRITELEISKGETKEQLNFIKDLLERVEKSVSSISIKLEKIENKPGKTYENLKYEVIKYIVIAVIAAAVAKLI